MKKTFTKLFSAGLLMGLTVIGFAANAQSTSISGDAQTAAPVAATTSTTATAMPVVKKETKSTDADTKEVKKSDDPVDTAWKPQRRVWGYAFGDYYYDAHSPALTSTQGKENNYYQVPTYRNAFQFRRIYLGYDYEITKRFKAEVLLSSEPTASTSVANATSANVQNGDNLVDGKMGFFIKNFNIRYRDLWTGTDFVIGELSTPGFALNESGTNAPTSLSEATWGYRSVERTITDFHKNNSYDVGASLQGTFDPATKNFGYVLMVANNSTSSLLSAANANTGFYKIFYGDIWAKFLNKKLYVDVYADYAKTAAATAAIGAQDHNMFKIFAAYNAKPFTIGVEAYTQKLANGVTATDPTTKVATPVDATVQGLSVWVKGGITKTLNYFARYDTYNPDTDFNGMLGYAVNTNYGSYDPTTKEQFVTAGLDWNPTKNVHFMPNVWFVQYKDQQDAIINGVANKNYLADNHTLVYRLTFFFTFGK
ncbi:hypothetical protein HDF24_23985 [Mucilaginibacter sp. X4EP1]|uniref:hypothetical protein n=1 Tax=Mucilaginibacter sp. X4EP1 TaxID=2723092 RepID=UPI00216AAA55|nr:hypothetical protein [Mucilaginibacter sp. X4EP1]MCS3816152.1 hypothetical protein [Mucilaginibacter sp. X4EP1]